METAPNFLGVPRTAAEEKDASFLWMLDGNKTKKKKGEEDKKTKAGDAQGASAVADRSDAEETRSDEDKPIWSEEEVKAERVNVKHEEEQEEEGE